LNHSALSGSLFAVIFDFKSQLSDFSAQPSDFFCIQTLLSEFKSHQSQLILPSWNLITQKKKNWDCPQRLKMPALKRHDLWFKISAHINLHSWNSALKGGGMPALKLPLAQHS
jgi:hypothetical protein